MSVLVEEWNISFSKDIDLQLENLLNIYSSSGAFHVLQ